MVYKDYRECLIVDSLQRIFGRCAITTTRCNYLALIRACADASTIACVGRRAALRLALVILEHEKGIWAGLKRGTLQRFIRSIALPLAYSIRAG
jgi:hypothetical protein